MIRAKSAEGMVVRSIGSFGYCCFDCFGLMVLHKGIFSIAVCFQIFWVFLSQFSFQLIIFEGNGVIRNQVITESKMPQNMKIPCEKGMNLMCPMIAALSEISSPRYSILSHSLVSKSG